MIYSGIKHQMYKGSTQMVILIMDGQMSGIAFWLVAHDIFKKIPLCHLPIWICPRITKGTRKPSPTPLSCGTNFDKWNGIHHPHRWLTLLQISIKGSPIQEIRRLNCCEWKVSVVSLSIEERALHYCWCVIDISWGEEGLMLGGWCWIRQLGCNSPYY